MSEKIKVVPLAEESLGVRSMCVYVETPDTRILLDAGVSLASKRLGYPPHPLEYKALADSRERICRKADNVDVVTVSHYHYDHHQLIQEWYDDKTVITKDPEEYINKSQRERAKQFHHLIKDRAKDVLIADNNRFVFGETTLQFSEPLWHGKENTTLGYIIMATIATRDDKILHSSDIMGPYNEGYTDLILREKPKLLILDGAPTYLLGYIQSYYNFCRCLLNLRRIITSKSIPKIILDHHCLRDYRYPELYHLAFQSAKEHKIVLHTAAEEIGKRPAVLGGYECNGPTKWKNWDKMVVICTVFLDDRYIFN